MLLQKSSMVFFHWPAPQGQCSLTVDFLALCNYSQYTIIVYDWFRNLAVECHILNTPQHPQTHTFSLYGNSHSQQV